MVRAALLSLAFAAQVHAAEMQFRDVAELWGLGGIVGTTGDSSYPDLSYVNGCGVAVGDVDGDGRVDLYVVQGGSPNLLFLNRGDRFEEVATAYGVDDSGRGSGAVFCDMNGDSYPELLLTNFGTDRYYRNIDGQRFELMDSFSDDGMGMGIAVADFDFDGLGDVYVARYVVWPELVPRSGGACQWKGLAVICGPEAYTPETDLFFAGQADGALLQVSPTPLRPFSSGRGMGVTVMDLEGDAAMEIYVANDASDNFLFRREQVTEGIHHWAEKALELGSALSVDGKAEAGMGVSAGDVDGDGYEDVVVTNFDGQQHSLYVHKPRGWFEEESQSRGLGAASLRRLSWGAQLADFDNDGDLDLHVVNGHLYANADEIGDGTVWKQPDDLFENDGSGVFRALAEGWDGVAAESGRGSAVLDFDDDGLLDLVVWNLGGPLRLLRNETVGAGNWIRVSLVRGEAVSEAAIIGTRLVAVDGAWNAMRLFRRGSGYLGCNDPRIHIGIGERESVEIQLGDESHRTLAREELTLQVSPAKP